MEDSEQKRPWKASVGSRMFCFLLWKLVIQVCSFGKRLSFGRHWPSQGPGTFVAGHRICAHFCMCVTLQYKVKRKFVEGHACSKRKYRVLRMLSKGFLEVGSEESPEGEARGQGWGGVRWAVPATGRQACQPGNHQRHSSGEHGLCLGAGREIGKRHKGCSVYIFAGLLRPWILLWAVKSHERC